MKIPTESYEAIYNDYSKALAWMSDIGVKFSSGRTNHYKRLLEHWKDHYKVATKIEEEKVFPDFVNSLAEVYHFIAIYKAFENIPKSELIHIATKLKKAINGPINAVSETSKTTVARNFLFEAFFAARAHRPDSNTYAMLDTISDTGIKMGKNKLWVECKRVTSHTQIEPNVKKACKQLESTFTQKTGANNRGIVALDVTKLLTKGDSVHVCRNDDELYKTIDKMMDLFIAEHQHIWQKIFTSRSKKIAGIIVNFSFMSTSESRRLLVNTSQWGLNPNISNSCSTNDMLKKLVSNLKD